MHPKRIQAGGIKTRQQKDKKTGKNQKNKKNTEIHDPKLTLRGDRWGEGGRPLPLGSTIGWWWRIQRSTLPPHSTWRPGGARICREMQGYARNQKDTIKEIQKGDQKEIKGKEWIPPLLRVGCWMLRVGWWWCGKKNNKRQPKRLSDVSDKPDDLRQVVLHLTHQLHLSSHHRYQTLFYRHYPYWCYDALFLMYCSLYTIYCYWGRCCGGR